MSKHMSKHMLEHASECMCNHRSIHDGTLRHRFECNMLKFAELAPSIRVVQAAANYNTHAAGL